MLQSLSQLEKLSPGARQIIPASAAVQSFFAQRDWAGAKLVSDMGGVETLDYDDPAAEARAAAQTRKLIGQTLGADDPFAAAMALERSLTDYHYPGQDSRALRFPDEVLNLGRGEQLIFADDLPGMLLAERRPYWTQRSMAGRFLPNPYHPPADRVQVMTRWGMRTRRVITAQVPPEFAHLPQYKNGMWTYVER